MPSDSAPQKSSQKQARIQRAAKRLLVLTVLLSMLLTAVIGLTGCNLWKKDERGLGHAEQTTRDAVTVFFSKYQGNESIVEEVVRKLPPDATSDPLQYAITELLKGPSTEEKSQGFYSEIPEGTRLLSLSHDSDTVTVNLSKQFTGGGGSTSIEQRVEELKQTVYSVDSKHKLNVAVEGKQLEVLGGEGLEVQESLKRDAQ